MTLIHAPYVESVFDDAEILAVVNGNIVAAKRGNQLVTVFHPEHEMEKVSVLMPLE